MSPALAIAAVSALYLVLLVPLALTAWKAAAAPVAAGYAVLLSLAAGYQSGLFSRTDLPDLDVAAAAAGPMATAAQCAEILSLLDRAGAFVDRRRPPRLVVVRDRWNQLPQQAQEAVVECVQRSWPRNAGPAQIEERTR